MAVPCGDERDYAFTNFFKGQKVACHQNIDKDISKLLLVQRWFQLDSDFLNGLGYKEGTYKVISN
jgi:leucyl-tRNA synthetase